MARNDITKWITDWISARPEYRNSSRLPVDQVTDAAMPDMPTRYADEGRRSYLRGKVVAYAKSKGMKNVAPKNGGESSIYAVVVEMPRLDFIDDFVRPQLRRMDNDAEALRCVIQEWLDVHTDEDLSVEDVITMARAA